MFALAASAQEKVALRRVTGGGALSGALNDVFQQGLDQVSLRARAVRALLRLDPAHARDLFEQIELPLDAKTSCDQQFLYDLSAYYNVMSEVVKSISDRVDRQFFLQRHVARMKSAAQIEPLIRLLSTASGSEEDLALVRNAFAERLPKLDPDSRVFSSVSQSALRALAQMVSRSPVAIRDYMLQQSRTWVLQGVNHGVCAQRGGVVRSLDGTTSRADILGPVDSFNQQLVPLSPTHQVSLIESKEVTKFDIGPPSKADRYSSEWLQFSRVLSLLAQDTSEAQASGRWKSEMEKHINSLIEWKNNGDQESALNTYYLEKCDRLQAVLAVQREFVNPAGMSQGAYMDRRAGIAPASIEGRGQAVLALVQFFEGEAANAVYNHRRILWFAPIRSLLRSAQQNTVDDLLAASSNPVLHCYGLLAKVLRDAGHLYN